MEVEKSIEALVADDILGAGLLPDDAHVFYKKLRTIMNEVGSSRPAIWRRVSTELLTPSHPHSLHQLMYYSTYRHWDTSKCGPPPACFPTEETARRSNLWRVLEKYGLQLLGSSYTNPLESFPAFQKFSAEHPEVKAYLKALKVGCAITCFCSSQERRIHLLQVLQNYCNVCDNVHSIQLTTIALH